MLPGTLTLRSNTTKYNTAKCNIIISVYNTLMLFSVLFL